MCYKDGESRRGSNYRDGESRRGSNVLQRRGEQEGQ